MNQPHPRLTVAFTCPHCSAPVQLELKLPSDMRWPNRYLGMCQGCSREVELRFGAAR